MLDALPRILEPHALLRGAAGEEDGYRSLLMVLVATFQPHLEALDRWIFEGELDDPRALRPSPWRHYLPPSPQLPKPPPETLCAT